MKQWGNRGEGGQSASQRPSTGNFWQLIGKTRQEKKGKKNGKMWKNEKRRIKLKNLREKDTEKAENFFFPLFTFRKPLKLFLGLRKWKFLLGKKLKSHRERIRKSEKISLLRPCNEINTIYNK